MYRTCTCMSISVAILLVSPISLSWLNTQTLQLRFYLFSTVLTLQSCEIMEKAENRDTVSDSLFMETQGQLVGTKGS